jgi:hypothetical protein
LAAFHDTPPFVERDTPFPVPAKTDCPLTRSDQTVGSVNPAFDEIHEFPSSVLMNAPEL